MSTALALTALEGVGLASLESIVSQSPIRQIVWTPTDAQGQAITNAQGNEVQEALVPAVVVEEEHRDELAITEHPVELGASITDHAYKRPQEVIIRAGWSKSGQGFAPATGLGSLINAPASIIPRSADPDYLTGLYTKLLDLQANRSLVTLTTGKRQYTNMLLRSLFVRTDERTENALIVTAHFRQVILVQTQVTPVPPAANQADPSKTGAVVNKGAQQLQPAPNYNAAGGP